MSTYYQYQDVKVKIAHRLMKLDGWTVYGYKPDTSDSMTDYYNPAYWNGLAMKNGYKLVVDRSSKQEDRTETRHRYIDDNQITADTAAKIAKLEQMTMERGASEAEEATAKAKIELLRQKEQSGIEEYTVFTPGHLANPPRCNWHIEKDGIIIDKGTGLLKFASVADISDDRELKDWQDFNNKSREQWIEDRAKYIYLHPHYWNNSDTDEGRRQIAEREYNHAKEKYALLEQFNILINRINTTCGGMVGNSNEFYTYKEVIKTEYKTELKPVEKPGSVKEGQCFIVKASFNYGHNKGYVYRIHESFVKTDGSQAYTAYKLGKGYKKECRGTAARGNEWAIYYPEKFMKWINEGALAFCDLEEVKTPYEVKKVIKVKVEAEQEETKEEIKEETTTEEEITSQEEEAEREEAATEEEPETRQEAETKAEAAEEAPAPETIKATFDGLPVVDTSTGEKVSDNAADMFSQLAAAYFQKKTIKSGKKAPEKAQEKPEEKREKQENNIDYSTKEMLYNCENLTVFYAKNGVTEDALKGVSDTGKELVFVTNECHLSSEIMEENHIHFIKIGVDLPENEIKLTGINEYARLAKVRIKAGYSGNNNDLLSDEERAELRQNNQVTVTREYYGKEYKKLYHTLNYVENVKLLYSASIEQDDSISPGKDSKYVGFIVGDRIITVVKPAFEKLKEDIERCIIRLVPDEKTAASLLENPEEEQQNNTYFLSQAREYFYKNRKPELAIYDGKPQGLKDLIEYFLHPEMVVDRYAKEYIEGNKIYILKAWIRYNRTLEEYRKITSDLDREEHKILKLSESVSDEKIVRLELRNKTEIKVEASAIKRMTYSNGTLSKWYICAADRNKVEEREIRIDDILTVKHGSKVLYKSA